MGSPKADSTKLVILALFTVSCIVFIMARLRFMDVPLDRDEGSYLYMGYGFLKGYVPYIDFYEIKPPGIFLVYGLFHLLFGSSHFLLHVGVLLTQLGTAWLIYGFMTRIFDQREPGVLAASVYFIFNIYPNFMGFGIMSEHFLVFFVLLSMYFLVAYDSRRGIKNLMLAGAFFGLAAMIRQHAIFFALPMLGLIIFMARKKKQPVFKNLLYFTSGSLLVIGALVGYVAIRGSFDEMLYWVFTHPSEKYITKVSWERGQQHLINYINNLFVTHHYPVLILFGLGLVMIFRQIILKKQVWENVIILLFFACAFMTIFPGYRFYGHYWLMVFPFFGMVAGKFLEKLPNRYFYAIFVMAAMLLVTQIYINKEVYFNINPDSIYQRLYQGNPNFALHKITKFLKRKIKKEDKVFVFGSEPQVYYETKKFLDIPHVFLSFLHLPSEEALEGQNATISYLTNQKPTYIIHVQNPISVGMKENSHQNLYQWIFGFEEQHYTKIAMAEIGDRQPPMYYYGNDAYRMPATDSYIYLYKLKITR